MSNSKSLNPQTCKVIAEKNDLDLDDLQDALTAYQKLDEKDHEERLKALKDATSEVTRLRKDKKATALVPVTKYLIELFVALQTEEKAVKAAQKENMTALKQAEAKERNADEGDEEEDEQGDYGTKLLAAFQKLKSAKDVAFQFIVCDTKPFCGLAVAKKITPKHKEELTKLTEGKRFLPIGSCRFENGKYVFTLEHPVTGLAKRLQDSVKNFTGKKLPIKIGEESVEAEEEAAAAAKTVGGASAKAIPPETLQKLGKVPNVWHGTRQLLMRNVDQLKTAVRKQFEQESPDLVAEIENTMKKLDGIFEALDVKLADSIAKAHSAKDPATQALELKNSRTILANYFSYVNSEPMIAHIDANPFGVKTNLKQTITQSLSSVRHLLAEA